MNNQITVIGHVGQTPVSKLFADTGNKVVKFSVGVTDYYSKSEEDKTMWIDVDAWNGLGERILATVTKGREVTVTGRLAFSNYTKDVNGVSVKMMKPVIKLTGYHLHGKKPESVETTLEEKPTKSRKLAAVGT